MGTGKISIRNNNKPNSTFRAFDIITKEYPGFPTDLQSPMVTYLTQVKGKSRVFESIFEGRFKYVEDLSKLGAKIEILGDREIVVDGPTSLRASSPHTDLTTHDIRAGFAVILGAIVASGKSKISNVHLVDRGYEEIEKVLGGLGVSIERV
jgi:UDP-N-acetylglucosamine 1-carboxyvinyltransferase